MSSPQYQLFAEARPAPEGYAWHFSLQAIGGRFYLDVTDQEPQAPLERLELLAVVRGLEALDHPSRVALVTPSRYVTHGLRYGLSQWRESLWQWESFGQMIPIKHEDLWRRVDQALSFHRVHCRTARLDPAESAIPAPAFARRRFGRKSVLPQRASRESSNARTPWLTLRQRVAEALMGLGQVVAPPPYSALAG